VIIAMNTELVPLIDFDAVKCVGLNHGRTGWGRVLPELGVGDGNANPPPPDFVCYRPMVIVWEENYQNRSVLCSVRQLCTNLRAHT